MFRLPLPGRRAARSSIGLALAGLGLVLLLFALAVLWLPRQAGPGPAILTMAYLLPLTGPEAEWAAVRMEGVAAAWREEGGDELPVRWRWIDGGARSQERLASVHRLLGEEGGRLLALWLPSDPLLFVAATRLAGGEGIPVLAPEVPGEWIDLAAPPAFAGPLQRPLGEAAAAWFAGLGVDRLALAYGPGGPAPWLRALASAWREAGRPLLTVRAGADGALPGWRRAAWEDWGAQGVAFAGDPLSAAGFWPDVDPSLVRLAGPEAADPAFRRRVGGAAAGLHYVAWDGEGGCMERVVQRVVSRLRDLQRALRAEAPTSAPEAPPGRWRGELAATLAEEPLCPAPEFAVGRFPSGSAPAGP